MVSTKQEKDVQKNSTEPTSEAEAPTFIIDNADQQTLSEQTVASPELSPPTSTELHRIELQLVINEVLKNHDVRPPAINSCDQVLLTLSTDEFRERYQPLLVTHYNGVTNEGWTENKNTCVTVAAHAALHELIEQIKWEHVRQPRSFDKSLPLKTDREVLLKDKRPATPLLSNDQKIESLNEALILSYSGFNLSLPKIEFVPDAVGLNQKQVIELIHEAVRLRIKSMQAERIDPPFETLLETTVEVTVGELNTLADYYEPAEFAVESNNWLQELRAMSPDVNTSSFVGGARGVLKAERLLAAISTISGHDLSNEACIDTDSPLLLLKVDTFSELYSRALKIERHTGGPSATNEALTALAVLEQQARSQVFVSGEMSSQAVTDSIDRYLSNREQASESSKIWGGVPQSLSPEEQRDRHKRYLIESLTGLKLKDKPLPIELASLSQREFGTLFRETFTLMRSAVSLRYPERTQQQQDIIASKKTVRRIIQLLQSTATFDSKERVEKIRQLNRPYLTALRSVATTKKEVTKKPPLFQKAIRQLLRKHDVMMPEIPADHPLGSVPVRELLPLFKHLLRNNYSSQKHNNPSFSNSHCLQKSLDKTVKQMKEVASLSSAIIGGNPAKNILRGLRMLVGPVKAPTQTTAEHKRKSLNRSIVTLFSENNISAPTLSAESSLLSLGSKDLVSVVRTMTAIKRAEVKRDSPHLPPDAMLERAAHEAIKELENAASMIVESASGAPPSLATDLLKYTRNTLRRKFKKEEPKGVADTIDFRSEDGIAPDLKAAYQMRELLNKASIGTMFGWLHDGHGKVVFAPVIRDDRKPAPQFPEQADGTQFEFRQTVGQWSSQVYLASKFFAAGGDLFASQLQNRSAYVGGTFVKTSPATIEVSLHSESRSVLQMQKQKQEELGQPRDESLTLESNLRHLSETTGLNVVYSRSMAEYLKAPVRAG